MTATVAVFVQAPADLAYAITISDDAVRRGANVVLIVVNVRTVYDYLLANPMPGVELFFVPYLLQPLPRSPWGLLRARRQLGEYFRAAFRGELVSEAWFFCTEWDAVTPSFLKRLGAARVFLVDHYGMNEPLETRWPLRLFIKWAYLRLITGISFGFCKETREAGTARVWRTAFDPSLVRAVKATATPTHGRFPLPAQFRPPIVIFMDANDESSPDITGYPAAATTLLNELRSRQVTVILKSHPRQGASPFLEQFSLPGLTPGCPLELYDLRQVAAVVGINSLGLAAAGKLGCTAISLLYMIGFRDESGRNFWREWMDRHSGGSVRFPRSLAETLELMAVPH